MPPIGHLLVKPVGSACNLGCSYCFYRQVGGYLPTGPVMEDAVLEKLVGELLAGRPEVAVFGWQGGEPTLAGLDFFRKVVAAQSRLGARGQRVGNALQTNGVLLDDEWARFLAEWRFLVGLSLDGPEPHHDRRRGKSWKAAMRAAEVMRRHNVAFNVLAVITGEAAEQGAELYRWFLGEGFTDVQFIPAVEPAALGRPAEWDARLADFTPRPESFGRFLVESFEEWRSSGLPRGATERTFQAMIAKFAGVDPGLCTFAPDCASYLVVERGGEVYPCDFFVRPEWRLGHVREGLPELAASPARKRFATLKSAAKPACGSCEWWELCHGGCPKDRAAVGEMTRPSPLCAAYKQFFAATVDWFRAEARRRMEECRRHEEQQRRAAAMRGRPMPPRTAGRNDPCPCGSGKKFKNCCERKGR